MPPPRNPFSQVGLPVLSPTRREFPLLVADIGGTHVRFGWVGAAADPLRDIRVYRCAEFVSPIAAATRYLQELAVDAPSRVAVAVASFVTDGPIKLTNSDWVFDAKAFSAHFDDARVEVFNDFEAIALVLPYLGPGEFQLVGAPAPLQTLTMAVIGPGTGLGVGGIVPLRGEADAWQSVCGEGGHTTIPGATEHQLAVIAAARRVIGHVSAEQLVSGLGLPALYRAVGEVEGLKARDINATEIGTLGSTRADALCERTLDTFCGLLGTVAGNVALLLGARGGVFIAGGIVPQWGAFFAQSSFREHFENKGRYRDYLAPIATPLITAPHPGLMGLVQHAIHTVPRGD